MENANLLTAFIAVTAAAVVVQALILIFLYLAVRKTSARMESLADDVKTKVLPTAQMVHTMLVEIRPKVDNVMTNVSESTTWFGLKWSASIPCSPISLIAAVCMSSARMR